MQINGLKISFKPKINRQKRKFSLYISGFVLARWINRGICLLVGGALELYSCYSKRLACYHIILSAFEGICKIYSQRSQRIYLLTQNGGIENNILYAPCGTFKAYVHQSFQILNSTDWIGTEFKIISLGYLKSSMCLFQTKESTHKVSWPRQEPN